jgi:EAL domain-containing protein (putative c-di-GMP-specific phosphodiesterase class I)
MGHSLNRKVLAEGVENSNQLHFLKSLDCDEVQGFYLAMPMTAEDLGKSLKGTNGKNISRFPLHN